MITVSHVSHFPYVVSEWVFCLCVCREDVLSEQRVFQQHLFFYIKPVSLNNFEFIRQDWVSVLAQPNLKAD